MTQRPEMLNQRSKKSPVAVAVSVFLGLLAAFLFVVFIFDLWVNATCYVVEVEGSSMENTVHDGDLLYARKNAAAKRGDIVIIDVEAYRNSGLSFSGNFIIKRLIAVEGDTVVCRNGTVSVKYAGEEEFTPLVEPYVKIDPATKSPYLTGDFDEVTVGEGEIFFMGDNRSPSGSYDARLTGCFKVEDIVGVVPQWAVSVKGVSTAWERFRSSLSGKNR